MTIDEIRNSKEDILKPKDISQILRIHPARINAYAKTNELPFPFFRSGSRVKIPRTGFLNWWDAFSGQSTGTNASDRAE